MIKRDGGAALVTTLLISLIIITVAMLVTRLVRAKVSLAIELKQSLRAEVNAENILQEALFILSTNRFNPRGIKWQEQEDTREWYFDGTAVSMPGRSLEIRDTNGIFTLWPVNFEHLDRLFRQNGISDSDRRIFMDSLRDWLDRDNFKHINGAEELEYKSMGRDYVPRNDYFQSREELLLINGMTREIWNVIKSEIKMNLGYYINPLTLPDRLMPVFFEAGEERIGQLLELKKRGELNEINFFTLFPEHNESWYISFFPSRRLIIRGRGSEGDVKCTREITVLFEEQPRTPFRLENIRIIPN